MANLKTYLAERYMSGPKADAILAHAGEKKKKRKRAKNEDYVGGTASVGGGGGLVLQDDDDWRARRRKAELEGEDAPAVGQDIATFKKGKSAWATVGVSSLAVPGREEGVKEEGDMEEADMEEGVENVKEEKAAQPPQLTKRRGGLRTAAQMAEEAALARAEAKSASPEPDAAQRTQTVHRDQSGRVLDVDQLKEEARLAEEEEKRKEREREEWTKGLVQREAREQQAREEQLAGEQDVARYADDAAMNREMAEVERWNDPAAQFLTAKKKKKKGPRYPKYQGAYPQNRFGIAPGYRWDGVDRSTGFEKKWIQAQNTAARETYEFNKWSAEDM